MRSSIECIPCLVRQAMEATCFATPDSGEREKIIRLLLREIAEADFNQPPPFVARRVHRLLREKTGSDDPYKSAKRRFNAMARELLPSFQERIAASADPFGAVVRLAIAGNVIDFGVKGNLSEHEVFSALERAFDEAVAGDIEAFKKDVFSAEKILYLADNAGEIVFDLPLIQALPAGSVTVAVRGGPIINDATIDDALEAGIAEVAAVIDNGSDVPGTVLEECREEFRRAYDEADMVIAKGQGNYETLCDTRKKIFFLFKVKCPVVSLHTGLAIGSHVIFSQSIMS